MRLCAIHQFVEEESELQEDMETLLQRLYEKYVPLEVREYIEN